MKKNNQKMNNIGFVHLIAIIVAFIVITIKVSNYCIDIVPYPAFHHGIHFLSSGDYYHIGYNEEYEFLITDSEMQVVFKSDDVRVAKPMGDIVKIELYDGRKGEINVLTKKVEIEGFFV